MRSKPALLLAIVCLVLSACVPGGAPKLSVEWLTPHADWTLVPDIYPLQVKVAGHGLITRMILYMDDAPQTTVTRFNPADGGDAANPVGTFLLTVPNGSHTLKVEADSGSLSSETPPLIVCGMGKTVMAGFSMPIYSPFSTGTSVSCPVTPDFPPVASEGTGIVTIEAPQVTPLTLAYPYKGCKVPDVRLEFAASANDPGDRVVRMVVSYTVNVGGKDIFSDAVNLVSNTRSGVTDNFYGPTTDLSPLLLAAADGGSGLIDWVVNAMDNYGGIITSTPPQVVPFAACKAPKLVSVHAPGVAAPNTPVPVSTGASGLSVALTSTATRPSLPTATETSTAAALTFTTVQVTPKTFNHRDANQATCTPNQIDLKVQVSDPAAVNNVLVFYKLTGPGSSTDWNNGTVMTPLGDGWYELKLPADGVPGAGGFQTATFHYQFVASDASQKVLARSQAYADVTLGVCK
ncbi:MAG TPA: hypothetical protein VMC09_13530 [Anaerolineales bacterium]|nr:hypothetical protein [Anaerolineales bacterium]